MSVLERLTVSETERPKLVEALVRSPAVSEAMLVSTCNRVEVYAVVEAFHPALEAVGDVFGAHTGMTVAELTGHAYVHYSEAAVEHLFTVAAGLDSMVVGEQQILGQIRTAYTEADQHKSAGRTLHELAQQALRVGKRVHHETDIDRAGASVVSVALHRAQAVRNAGAAQAPIRRAVVFGAGAMGSLATSQLARDGVREITVVNRTAERATELAALVSERYGIVADGTSIDSMADAMADADVVVTCTGSVSSVVGVADVHTALTRRTNPAPLLFCDLGIPRDVDPVVAALPGVAVVDIEGLRDDEETKAAHADAVAARGIVADELAGYLAAQRQAEVTPTVAALRQRAADVVEAEILRLQTRLPDLDGAQRDEVAKAVRRVADKLLHAPTVRVKQLASSGRGDHYAEALRELFELKPGAAESVSGVASNGDPESA
ncbi:glutamyl-tRNA reductase [Gordonia spumicola]|uniref:Glutamyl-tRNA reductase n=1 Tax=Gordonia spumicola TaxID=589161 RepID=A0A7I9V384_9ACTN|nr:glutamyl-tRNA reductase [Gordonia spumicola]